jgi:hypothetical protein
VHISMLYGRGVLSAGVNHQQHESEGFMVWLIFGSSGCALSVCPRGHCANMALCDARWRHTGHVDQASCFN